MSQLDNLELLKASVQAQTSGLKSIEVPLPGRDPIRVYFRPMTLREKGRILKIMDRNVGEALAETYILRALDADGNRLYSLGMKAEILDTRGLDRIVEQAVDAMSDADKEDQVEGAPDAGN